MRRFLLIVSQCPVLQSCLLGLRALFSSCDSSWPWVWAFLTIHYIWFGTVILFRPRTVNNHFTVDPEPLEVETVSKSCDNFINQSAHGNCPHQFHFWIDLSLSETTNALAATKVNCTVRSVSHVKNIHVPNPRSRACENACNCGSPFAVAGFRHRSNSTSVSLFISSTFCS